ncbi:MAG: hypothetical protein FD123_2225 [Bacteroidetes bacterium]|nr:MAG: hypothetical protein FD123_2225 [Bacteroidota bacterium]
MNNPSGIVFMDFAIISVNFRTIQPDKKNNPGLSAGIVN